MLCSPYSQRPTPLAYALRRQTARARKIWWAYLDQSTGDILAKLAGMRRNGIGNPFHAYHYFRHLAYSQIAPLP